MLIIPNKLLHLRRWGMPSCPKILLSAIACIAMLLGLFNTNSANAAAMGTNAEIFVASNVGDAWVTVSFENTYSNPIPVCTYTLGSLADRPASVRITNITSSSMQIRAQLFGTAGAVTPDDVQCLVVEAGTQTLPDGTKYHAGSIFTTNTHGQNAPSVWKPADQIKVTPPVEIAHPILLASIMSFNDSRPSAPFVTDCDQAKNPAFMAGFWDGACVGLHIGMENSSRTGETIGYIAIEKGTSSFSNIQFTAGLTPDAVVGPANTYYMSVPESYDNAVLTQNAMDGINGSWAVLRGTSPLASSKIAMSVDEDQLANATNDRTHTNEQVAYFAAKFLPVSLDIAAKPDLTWVAESREIKYKVTVTNTGTYNLSNFDLEASFPEGSSVIITSPDAPFNDGTPNELAPGEVWTYTATFSPTQAYVSANIGSNIDGVFSTLGNSAIASTNIHAATPSVAVTKVADKTQDVAAGDTITYTIEVENTGNVTLYNINLSDSTNGSATPPPTPGQEEIATDANISNDSSDAALDGKWDKLGFGDKVKFTSTYIVTPQDIEDLQ